MKRTNKTDNVDQVDTNDQVDASADDQVEGDDTASDQVEGDGPEGSGDADAAAEFDAAADAKAEGSGFATFTVECWTAENSAARAQLGENPVATVTRANKRYQASLNGVEGTIGARSGKTAIERAVKALGLRKEEFPFLETAAAEAEKAQAPMPESDAGHNAGADEKYFFDIETEAGTRLHALEADAATADELLIRSGADEKAGNIMIGRIINAATDIFHEAGFAVNGEGDAGKKGNKAFGEWVTRFLGAFEHVVAALKSKNDRARFGRFAQAPEALLKAMPGIRSPGSFEKSIQTWQKTFADAVAEVQFKAVEDAEVKEFGIDDQIAGCLSAHERRVAKYKADKAKHQEAVDKANDSGKPTPQGNFGTANAENLAIDWLLGDGSAYKGSLLHTAVEEAWKRRIEAPSEAQKVETAVKAASATVVKHFKDKTVEEQADQVVTLIMASSVPAQVYERVGEKMNDAVEAQIAKLEADKKAAEEAQSAA